MSTNFDPRANYEQTKQQAGYVERKKATQEDYDRIGFMSGLFYKNAQHRGLLERQSKRRGKNLR